MTDIKLYDSLPAARMALDAINPELSFSSAIRDMNFSRIMETNDAQAVLNFLQPQLLQTTRAKYYIKYAPTNFREFMPVDASGDVFTPGSLFYSGDIVGEMDFFEAGNDDMNFADVTETQHIQENVNAGIGYEWTMKDLRRAQMTGKDILTEKMNAANMVAERWTHKVAMLGDGVKFTSGFINGAAPTTAAGMTLAAATPDQASVIMNNALAQIEQATKETYLATTLVLPTVVRRQLENRRMTDIGMNVLEYLIQNASVPNLTIKHSRHLTTTMIAYADTLETHRFHLPGGGLVFGDVKENGFWGWKRGGILNIGGYERSIPNAFNVVTGIA